MAKKKKKSFPVVPVVIGVGALLLLTQRSNAQGSDGSGVGLPGGDPLPAPGGGSGGSVGEPGGGIATITNKNPGAILATSINWNGEVTPIPGYTKWEAFKDWPHGWRAFIKNSDYHIRQGQNTLSKLINRHAMGFSGKTAPNYIAFVSQGSGFGVNEPLPVFSNTDAYFDKMWPILREMAIFEGGAGTRNFYNSQRSVFRQGMALV